MTVRAAIDPDLRLRGDQTCARIEDVDGTVVAGSRVEAYDRGSGRTWPAEVSRVDRRRGVVYLDVHWSMGAEQVTVEADPESSVEAIQAAARWLAKRVNELIRPLRLPEDN